MNRAMTTRYGELQQKIPSIGRVRSLMSAWHDKSEIKNYLDLEDEKRAVDEKMGSNEKLRDDKIKNGENVDEADYAAACQNLLRKWSYIKIKSLALLKSRDERASSGTLEDAEQRLADVRANSAADKSLENGTSPTKDQKLDDEQE